MAAGRNHFAEPAVREPVAPRYTPAPSSGSRPAAPWPNAQPGYQKQQGEVYRQLCTPAPMQKPKAPEPQEPALAANSQSFGRVLTIVHSDCALLERDGNIFTFILASGRTLAASGTIDAGVKCQFAPNRCLFRCD